MPFKSEAQRRFLYANHPEIAKRWSREEAINRRLQKIQTEKKPKK